VRQQSNPSNHNVLPDWNPQLIALVIAILIFFGTIAWVGGSIITHLSK
jgi:hypothetical protein